MSTAEHKHYFNYSFEYPTSQGVMYEKIIKINDKYYSKTIHVINRY